MLNFQIIEDVEIDNKFSKGELLVIKPKQDKEHPELTPDLVTGYDFGDLIKRKSIDSFLIVGKRIHLQSGTTCLYLCPDLVLTDNQDEDDREKIDFIIHRVLIENNVYWLFDIFLAQQEDFLKGEIQ